MYLEAKLYIIQDTLQSWLETNGLLEQDEAEKLYKITEKGRKFMKVYSQMHELTGRLQEQV